MMSDSDEEIFGTHPNLLKLVKNHEKDFLPAVKDDEAEAKKIDPEDIDAEQRKRMLEPEHIRLANERKKRKADQRKKSKRLAVEGETPLSPTAKAAGTVKSDDEEEDEENLARIPISIDDETLVTREIHRQTSIAALEYVHDDQTVCVVSPSVCAPVLSCCCGVLFLAHLLEVSLMRVFFL